MKNKYLRGFVAALVMSSMVASSVVAAPDANAIKKKKEETQSEVQSLQNELQRVITQINDLEEDLIEKGEEITKAEEDLKVAEELEQEQYEAMKLRIKYMYEEGDNTALEKIVQSGSIGELLSQAEYVQSVHNYDRKQLDEYVQTKEKIEALKEKLVVEQKELEKTQVQFANKKKDLDQTLVSKKEEVEDLEKQFQAALEAAAKEAEEKRREEERRRQEQLAASQSRPSYNNTVSSNENYGKGDTSVAQAIINAAYSQLGTPYVWGGTRPNAGLDCSGLTQYCHRVAGISIPRTSGPQGAGGRAVSNPQPGDIVCYSGHVGIYIGSGKMIHAPQPGDVVRIQSVYGRPWYRRYW